MIVEKNTLYQVNKPSLRDISLPKTGENPRNSTAVCSNKYDFFIKYLPFNVNIYN
jgi:hypothetical protein